MRTSDEQQYRLPSGSAGPALAWDRLKAVMDTYVISPKRKMLDALPDDWQDRVVNTAGVKLVGATQARMQVAADDEAIAKLRAEFEDLVYIEKAVPREVL